MSDSPCDGRAVLLLEVRRLVPVPWLPPLTLTSAVLEDRRVEFWLYSGNEAKLS